MGLGVIKHTLNILAVDDDVSFCEALRALFCEEYDIRVVHTASDSLTALSRGKTDLILLDILLPDLSGLDLLKRLREQSPQIPVIMLTGNTDLRTAISAIKAGAFDYVVKGTRDFEDELRARIGQAERHISLLDHTAKLEQRLSEEIKKYQLVGNSVPIIKLRSHIVALRGRDASIILTGESGVGKEVVARILNYQDGLQRPFVAVNCGAIPADLLESELFGHEKGAFTGAIQKQNGKFFAANGGKIFLDEIGDMPLAMQVKLLRVLQERTISPVGSNKVIPIQVKVIAATNKDLTQAVREGAFREDLYYRLSVIPLHIPPLRERPEDIELLVRHFLEELGAGAIRVPVETINHLKRHRWPGNIRALRNCIERALFLIQGTDAYILKPEHIVFDDATADSGNTIIVPKWLLPMTSDDLNSRTLDAFIEWAEQIFYDHAYLAVQRNKTKLAARLNVSRNFLHGKLKSLGIGYLGVNDVAEAEVSQ